MTFEDGGKKATVEVARQRSRKPAEEDRDQDRHLRRPQRRGAVGLTKGDRSRGEAAEGDLVAQLTRSIRVAPVRGCTGRTSSPRDSATARPCETCYHERRLPPARPRPQEREAAHVPDGLRHRLGNGRHLPDAGVRHGAAQAADQDRRRGLGDRIVIAWPGSPRFRSKASARGAASASREEDLARGPRRGRGV